MYSNNVKNIYQLIFFSCKVESNILGISTSDWSEYFVDLLDMSAYYLYEIILEICIFSRMV